MIQRAWSRNEETSLGLNLLTFVLNFKLELINLVS